MNEEKPGQVMQNF